MQPITIQTYHPDTDTTEDLTYQVPTEFHELTPVQFVRAVATMRESERTPAAQWMLVPLLMGIPVAVADRLSEVQRVQLLAQMDFLYDPAKLPYQWLVPGFTLAEFGDTWLTKGLSMIQRTERLYGPGDGLKYLTFGEFMHAEQRYEQYQKTGRVAPLNELCGILYRRAHPKRRGYEDPRLPFVSSLIPTYAKAAGKAHEHFKAATVLNYHGAKAQFSRLYKHIFPPKLQGITKDKPAQKTGQALTWLNTAIQMAERDVTKIAAIEASPLHLVLKVLDDTLAHNEAMRAEYEKMRRS